MRFSKINRYLVLLAALFALAVIRPVDLPGEEILPAIFGATVHPLLAPVAAAAHGDALKMVELESELKAARLEIRRLREQLATTHKVQEYLASLRWSAQPVAVPAWVVSVDADPYRRTFRIDRGETDGIVVGEPVVIGKALLGVVLSVVLDGAVVRRVDDPGFRLEVEIQAGDTAVRGIARGDGDQGLDIGFVHRTQGLRVGDDVFTTSYHEHIPAGLVVGRVEAVSDIDQDGIHEVAAAPAAALGRWALVHVLKRSRR